jgi:hypothetical protein
MSKVKRVLGLAGIVLLALALLFGCARLFWGTTGQSGWYIRLNIGDPGSKAISVEEYDVTQVDVGIFAPGETLPFYTLTWYAGDDPVSELIPVSEEGEYEIQVTQVADNNGEPVEAKESASFNIAAMVITVINVTPGAVGVIAVDGENVGDPWAWMYGYWLQDECALPYSDYLEIREDGTYWWWINYDGSGGIDESGTWYVDSGLLIIVMEGMEVPTEVVKLSDDELIFIMFGEEEHFYRKGTEPCWVFDLPPTELPVSSDWTVREFVDDDEVQLFTFQAPVSGTYEISWKQAGDPDLPVFTGKIKVSAYRSDQETQIFWQDMSGYFSPVPVQVDTDELIYIIVDDDPGTYGIRVLQPVP